MKKAAILLFASFCLLMIGAAKTDFIGECLFAHNKAREQHVDTPMLTWDFGLAQSAEAFAKQLATVNKDGAGSGYVINHSAGSGHYYGENIYAGTDGGFSERKIAHAMYFWYNEGIGYRYENPSPFGSTGHFTQVIWKSTTGFGCGKAAYYKDMSVHTIIVCQYKPKGNISMKYILNVKKLKTGGKASLSIEDLTGVQETQGSACAYSDAVPMACDGMKAYCNNPKHTHLMKYLQENCKKTCNC